MKIVIDIPEWMYKEICDSGVEKASPELYWAVYNGTPLPKHHGRLIDVDDLYENTEICHSDKDGYACVRWKDINDAPTIIEGSEKRTCTNCLLDGTDACSRGAGRAIDDRVCEDFI